MMMKEFTEDHKLGLLAKARDRKSKPHDYIKLDEFEKRIKSKKYAVTIKSNKAGRLRNPIT